MKATVNLPQYHVLLEIGEWPKRDPRGRLRNLRLDADVVA